MFLVIKKLRLCGYSWNKQDEVSAWAILNSLQGEQEIHLLPKCHTPIWEKLPYRNQRVIHVVLSKYKIHAALSLLDVLQVLIHRLVSRFELLMLARCAVTLPCDEGGFNDCSVSLFFKFSSNSEYLILNISWKFFK